MKHQHGILLLPVALALAVMGALAYAMAREGGADAADISARYDREATRYLAEAGIRLAKWQNEKRGCNSEVSFTNARLPDVVGTVSVTDIKADKKDFRATVTAASGQGAASSLTRDKMPRFDRSRPFEVPQKDSQPKDTYITSNFPSASNPDSLLLEATDGKAHILLNVSLSGVPKEARVLNGTVSLYLASSDSVQSVRELSVHAPTRTWTEGNASWTTPWNTSPGGSYLAQPEATAVIGGIGRTYTWDITRLVRDWDSGVRANTGMLFKPSGLNRAQFNGMKAGGNRPQVTITYHPRCT